MAPEYAFAVQAKLVHALAVVHNFIQIHDPDDIDTEEDKEDDEEGEEPRMGTLSEGSAREEVCRATER